MGMNQQKAADALGISRSTLQQIERGVLPLSEEIQRRMHALSGAYIPTGICSETIAPVTLIGTPYDANSLERLRETWGHLGKRYHALILSNLEFFLRDADRKGSIRPFLFAVLFSLHQLAEDFHLDVDDEFSEFVRKRMEEFLEERESKAPKAAESSRKRREQP